MNVFSEYVLFDAVVQIDIFGHGICEIVFLSVGRLLSAVFHQSLFINSFCHYPDDVPF